MGQHVRQWVVMAMVAAVRAYQVMLRPLLPGCCRYQPGCSEYFIEAVRRHGPLRGGWLGFQRIMRCRPGGGWGYDPVPPVAPLHGQIAGRDDNSTHNNGTQAGNGKTADGQAVISNGKGRPS